MQNESIDFSKAHSESSTRKPSLRISHLRVTFNTPRQLVKEPKMKVLPDQCSIEKPCYDNFYRHGQIFLLYLCMYAVMPLGSKSPFFFRNNEEIDHFLSTLKLFTSSMIDFSPMCSGSNYISTSQREHFGYTYMACYAAMILRAAFEQWSVYSILLRTVWDYFDGCLLEYEKIIGQNPAETNKYKAL